MPPWNTQPLHVMCLCPWAAAAAAAAAAGRVGIVQGTHEELAAVQKRMNRCVCVCVFQCMCVCVFECVCDVMCDV